MKNDELKHYGVKGMKWGIRRTPAQLGHTTKSKKKREAADEDSGESKPSAGKRIASAVKNRRAASQQKKVEKSSDKQVSKKKVSEMSDEELRRVVKRLQLEEQYANLNPRKVSAGEKFAKTVMNQMVIPAATNAGQQLLREYLLKEGRRIMNENNKKK